MESSTTSAFTNTELSDNPTNTYVMEKEQSSSILQIGQNQFKAMLLPESTITYNNQTQNNLQSTGQELSSLVESQRCCSIWLLKFRGMILMLLVVLITDISRIFTKVLYNQNNNLTPLALSFQRSLGMLVVVLLIYAFHQESRQSLKVCKKVSGLLTLRTTVATINSIITMFAAQLLKYSTFVVVFFIGPLIAPFIGVCVLKQKVKVLDIMALIVSFCGLLIYSNPNFIYFRKYQHIPGENVNHLLGYVFALMGTLCTAGDIILLRKIGTVRYYLSNTGEYTQGVHFFPPLFFVVVSLFFASMLMEGAQIVIMDGDVSHMSLNIYEFLMIMGLGLSSVTGTFLQILASKYEKAGKLSIMWFTEIIFAFTIQIAVFNGRIRLGQVIGAAMILFASLAVTLMKLYQKE